MTTLACLLEHQSIALFFTSLKRKVCSLAPATGGRRRRAGDGQGSRDPARRPVPQAQISAARKVAARAAIEMRRRSLPGGPCQIASDPRSRSGRSWPARPHLGHAPARETHWGGFRSKAPAQVQRGCATRQTLPIDRASLMTMMAILRIYQ